MLRCRQFPRALFLLACCYAPLVQIGLVVVIYALLTMEYAESYYKWLSVVVHLIGGITNFFILLMYEIFPTYPHMLVLCLLTAVQYGMFWHVLRGIHWSWRHVSLFFAGVLLISVGATIFALWMLIASYS